MDSSKSSICDDRFAALLRLVANARGEQNYVPKVQDSLIYFDAVLVQIQEDLVLIKAYDQEQSWDGIGMYKMVRCAGITRVCLVKAKEDFLAKAVAARRAEAARAVWAEQHAARKRSPKRVARVVSRIERDDAQGVNTPHRAFVRLEQDDAR